MIERWLTSTGEVDEALRAELVRCWRDVSDAGGAVGFPHPPVSEGEVSAAVDALLARLRPGLEGFYAALGWRVVGAWPGALRVGEHDVRDEVLMVLDLT